MEGMKFGSLFSGVGGMDLGLERAGMECAWQVEIDPFCRKILAKHWKDVPKYDDVRTVGKHNLELVDLIAGGFPCQDISVASSTRSGLDGERSGLWNEHKRIIRLLRPRYALIENSSALLNRGLDRILCDLAAIGYDAEWEVIRASDVGAPHRRERLFIVAYTNKSDGQARMGAKQDGARKVFKGGNSQRFPIWLQTADSFIGMDDGISSRLYESRVGGIGNAVVPQIAEYIGRRIIGSAI
jgi:DNA (cytosine-5)-methyltransferase 1